MSGTILEQREWFLMYACIKVPRLLILILPYSPVTNWNRNSDINGLELLYINFKDEYLFRPKLINNMGETQPI